jgi:hypothetical protein
MNTETTKIFMVVMNCFGDCSITRPVCCALRSLSEVNAHITLWRYDANMVVSACKYANKLFWFN